MKRVRPTYSGVVSTLALVVALSGTAYAATALPKNSVGTKQLKNDAVTAKKLHDGSVDFGSLTDGFAGDLQTALSQAGIAGSPLVVSGGESPIQAVTTTPSVVGSLTVPADGDYLVFPVVRVAGSGASIYCNVNLAGGPGRPELTNPALGTGANYPMMVGLITDLAAGDSLDLTCNTGTGSLNVSWNMNAIQVRRAG